METKLYISGGVVKDAAEVKRIQHCCSGLMALQPLRVICTQILLSLPTMHKMVARSEVVHSKKQSVHLQKEAAAAHVRH